MIILDTNVISELMRPPSASVVHWISGLAMASLYITSITQAEILHGILLLPAGRRRTAIESAAQDIFSEDFNGRVLPFGSNSASAYASIAVERRKLGRPISQFDAQIAAIARCHAATIATRNTADFEGCGVKLNNPWQAS